MDVRTKADSFEYQYIEVLKEMAKEAAESKETFDSDYVWDNKERLGELFYNAIHNYADIDTAISSIDTDKK